MEDKFLKENLYLFIGNFTSLFLSYIFQIYLGHTFSPEEYGIIGTIFSILTIISLLLYSTQISIIQFVKKNQTQNLFNPIIKYSFIIGSIMGIIILALSPLLSSFLNISIYFFVMIALATLLIMIVTSARGILQGLEKFKFLSLSYSLEGLIRLLFGIFYVYLGFQINGIMGALLTSYILSFIIIYFALKKEDTTKTSINVKEIYSTAPYNLTALLFLNLLGTIDIILARHFLTPLDTGYYTAITTFGKIIPALCTTIGLVLISKTTPINDTKILTKSLLISLFISIPFILLFFIFPELIIKLSLGSNYLEAAKYLGFFGIAISIYSLIVIITYYLIGLENKRSLIIMIIFLILEIILISIFHSSIIQIITIIFFIMLSLLTTLLFLVYLKKKPRE